MDFKALGSGNTSQQLSIIKDPFKVDKITAIHLHFWAAYSKPHWDGTVEFKNGKTSGDQKLEESETLDQIIAQIKTIAESLK